MLTDELHSNPYQYLKQRDSQAVPGTLGAGQMLGNRTVTSPHAEVSQPHKVLPLLRPLTTYHDAPIPTY